jgi:ribonucleotide reductase alpha subunit
MFAKENLSGNFQIFNKHFQRDMDILNLWNEEMKDKVIINDGKVTNITEIPEKIRNIYKSIWEIKQTDLIQMDADRGRFVDQSHSSNRYVEKVNNSKVYTIIKTAWEKGLKTGSYYLRSKASSKAIQFSVDSVNSQKQNSKNKTKESVDNSSKSQSDFDVDNSAKQSNSKSRSDFDADTKLNDFKKWLAESKKKAETGECEACQ